MSEPTSENVRWHAADIDHDERESCLGQRGCVVWLTGLSGSGKSTIARAVEAKLLRRGRAAYVLDGDNLRLGLNGDLGFGADDRSENIRRVGHVAQLFADAGLITLSSFISPYRADRAQARSRLPAGRFFECHVATPLEECERRDPKGLYRRVRAGEIAQFTGITDPYEPPEHPELHLQTAGRAIDDVADEVIAMLDTAGMLSA